MTYYFGRLLDHVHLRTRDLSASRKFYRAVLQALGKLDAFGEGQGYFYADELYVDQAAETSSSIHLAFQAGSKEQVQAFFELAVAAGGTPNGEPGHRKYHASYFAAYVLDPDGNNVEAVYHGPAHRSADSVQVSKLSGQSGA